MRLSLIFALVSLAGTALAAPTPEPNGFEVVPRAEEGQEVQEVPENAQDGDYGYPGGGWHGGGGGGYRYGGGGYRYGGGGGGGGYRYGGGGYRYGGGGYRGGGGYHGGGWQRE